MPGSTDNSHLALNHSKSKSEVIRVRDKFLAMEHHPSIDAVRQELGNTGSKATIHRYLKEIEEEAGLREALEKSLANPLPRFSERTHARVLMA